MNNLLKRYLSNCNATASELSEKSGLSLATISRYLNGVRTPDIEGTNIVKLSEGLYRILEENNMNARLSQEDILQDLKNTILSGRPEMVMGLRTDNLNKLIMQIGISKAKFAEEMFYSPSAMTRILSGENKPRNIRNFVNQTGELACRILTNNESLGNMQEFLRRETGIEANTYEDTCKVIELWLLGIIEEEQQASTAEFLGRLDEFDYETYISGVDTEAVGRIPMTNFKIPVSKAYAGQEGMEEGITAFLKATVTSASMEPIFMFSDHPIDYLSKNLDTIELWKKGIGASILQGKQIQILHNLNRPYDEMLLGIENWLPLYMTGNVQSYYSDSPPNKLFNHILMVSGGAVFSGFATSGVNGQYNFSKSTTRISEGRKNADILLSDAKILVEAFNKNKREEFSRYLEENANIPGDRLNCSDDLPIHVLSDELIDKVLVSSKMDNDKAYAVKRYADNERRRIESITKHSKVSDIVMVGEKNANQFRDLRIVEGAYLKYGQEDYLEHLRLAKKYAEGNDNYQLILLDANYYKNIRIALHTGRHAIITRNTNQMLHLMVRHPRLVESIEREVRKMHTQA